MKYIPTFESFVAEAKVEHKSGEKYELQKTDQYGFLSLEDAETTRFSGNNKLDPKAIKVPLHSRIEIVSETTCPVTPTHHGKVITHYKVLSSSNKAIEGKDVYSTEFMSFLGLAVKN